MSELLQIITTLETAQQAKALGNHLLEKRLVACVQIIGPIESVYWWDNVLQTAQEWQCVMKAPRNLYPEIEAEIQNHHPYEIPEILALSVEASNVSYRSWVNEVCK